MIKSFFNNKFKRKDIQDYFNILLPFRLTLIDRYLIKEFIKTALMALSLFITIFLFSLLINDIPYFINQMEAGDKSITLNKILIMYANQIPHKALWVSPLAFLFSTIYTLGNFYKNNEAVAYINAGVHLFRITFFFMVISLVYSILLIPFTDKVIVPTFDKAETLSLEMRHKSEGNLDNDLEVFGRNNMYYFIKKYDPIGKAMHYPIIAKERSLKENVLAYNIKAFFTEDEKEKAVDNRLLEKKPVKITKNDISKVKEKDIKMLKTPKTKGESDLKAIDPKELAVKQNEKSIISNTNKLPLAQDKKESTISKNNNDPSYYQIIDDFLYSEKSEPVTPVVKTPETKSYKTYFQQFELPSNFNLSPLKEQVEDNFSEQEKKYLNPDIQIKPEKKSLQSLIETHINFVNKDKLIEQTTSKLETPKNNVSIEEPVNKNEKKDSQKPKKEVKKNWDDIYYLSQLPPDRDHVYKTIRIKKNYARYFNKNLRVEKKIEQNKEVKAQPTKIKQNITTNKRPLEAIEEGNIMEMSIYKEQTSVENLITEQELSSEDPSLSKFKINKKKYYTVPYTSYFEFRIDATKVIWDDKINKWIVYNGEKRYWDKERGLIKVEKFDKYILNESNDKPEHFFLRDKEIERLTFQEGINYINSLKRARKKWRDFQIDLYSKKLAFQLSTFLIVFVGVTLGKFYSRKLVFINSLFKAILVFIFYFVLFQLGVSLAKVTDILPISVAPWLGNFIFFILGILLWTNVISGEKFLEMIKFVFNPREFLKKYFQR
ncbi:MAG: LptF/LptG family permease [Spirochaetota bacterium]|nr:LptF/LptG family permease [Spirochaetota bacterium]